MFRVHTIPSTTSVVVVICLMLSINTYVIGRPSYQKRNNQSVPHTPTATDKSKSNQKSQENEDQVKKERKQSDNTKKPPVMKADDGDNAKETQLIQEKRLLAQTISERVEAGINSIESPEYKILVQAEMVSVLWRYNNFYAHRVFKELVVNLRELLSEGTSTKSLLNNERKARLRLTIVRKLATLDSDLLKELEFLKEGKEIPENVSGGWTEEAQSILIAAREEINRNPEKAVKMAKESFAFGQPAGLGGFLRNLSYQDKQLAEREAISLINLLRDSNSSPTFFVEVANYIFSDKNNSEQLKEHYFRAFVARLRRGIKFDQQSRLLEGYLFSTRDAIKLSINYPTWQEQFIQLEYELGMLFRSRSASVPADPGTIKIDMSETLPASTGDTAQLKEAVSKAASIVDINSRDKEYVRLAIDAAKKNDEQLAEAILAKITDKDLRQSTTTTVYSPLIRKAISELDWLRSKNLTLKIADPLSRSIIVNEVSSAMLKAQEKDYALQLYADALEQLEFDGGSLAIVMSHLILAKPLMTIDEGRGFNAVNSTIQALNTTAIPPLYSKQLKINRNVSSWVTGASFTDFSQSLDVTDMLSSLFQEIARRNNIVAQVLASSISHQGLNSLAQLGIVKTIFEDVDRSGKNLKGAKR